MDHAPSSPRVRNFTSERRSTELQSRPYVYGTDCLPWDGGMPSLQTGRSIRDQLIAAGRHVKVMPQIKREIGIQAARTIFGKCFFGAPGVEPGVRRKYCKFCLAAQNLHIALVS